MRGQERLEHDRQPRNSTIRIFQLFQWVPVQNCLACVGGGASCKESAITTSLHLYSFVRGWGTPSECRHWWKVIQYHSHVTHESKLYLTFVPVVPTHMQKFDSMWHLRKSTSSRSIRSRIFWAGGNYTTSKRGRNISPSSVFQWALLLGNCPTRYLLLFIGSLHRLTSWQW